MNVKEVSLKKLDSDEDRPMMSSYNRIIIKSNKKPADTDTESKEDADRGFLDAGKAITDKENING